MTLFSSLWLIIWRPDGIGALLFIYLFIFMFIIGNLYTKSGSDELADRCSSFPTGCNGPFFKWDVHNNSIWTGNNNQSSPSFRSNYGKHLDGTSKIGSSSHTLKLVHACYILWHMKAEDSEFAVWWSVQLEIAMVFYSWFCEQLMNG